jgi:hypothetical protein
MLFSNEALDEEFKNERSPLNFKNSPNPILAENLKTLSPLHLHSLNQETFNNF